MIDVAEIIRLILVADAGLVAATGGAPCRIYHGQVPPEIDEDWKLPEDVKAMVFIASDGEADATAPMADAEVDVTCWAATHEESQVLAELVAGVLEAVDRVEIGPDGVYVGHVSQTGLAQNRVDVETLKRFTDLSFETLMIE